MFFLVGISATSVQREFRIIRDSRIKFHYLARSVSLITVLELYSENDSDIADDVVQVEESGEHVILGTGELYLDCVA